MDLMTTKQAAEKWSITTRRVQALCENVKIDGAEKLADMWVLPIDAVKPIDGRTLAAKGQANKISKGEIYKIRKVGEMENEGNHQPKEGENK